MRFIPSRMRQLVVRRAGNRCEYCWLPQEGQEATFHVDHVIPVVAGGMATADNLALACVSCSLHKWARQVAVDPESGHDVLLYNPRREDWHEHFAWEGGRIAGLTPTGRATVLALRMNRPSIVAVREQLILLGLLPRSR